MLQVRNRGSARSVLRKPDKHNSVYETNQEVILTLQNDLMQYSFKCVPHIFLKYDSTYKNGIYPQSLGIHVNLANTHSWNVFYVQGSVLGTTSSVATDPSSTVK